MLKNKKLFFVPIVLIILFFVFGRSNNQDTFSPKTGTVIESIYAMGTVTARKTYQLKVGVPLAIHEIFVKEGDAVQKGDALAKMTDVPLFKAPFSGTVTGCPFRAGENVFPNIPIITLTDLKDLYIVASLEQQGALRVVKGQTVRLSFESLRGEKIFGKVKSIFPNDGQFYVNLDVDQMPPAVLPGMTADVAIEIGKKENVLLVPVNAVNGGKITIIRNGQKQKIPIQLGIIDGVWAEVTAGDVKLTDKVLVGSRI